MFTGEVGGLIAGGFISGVGVGWGIAQKTIVRIAEERIDELKVRIDKQDTLIKELQDSRFNLAVSKNADD